MRIDTSFPETSKYFLWLDVPYRYAGRHFAIAFSDNVFNKDDADSSPSLSCGERVAHFSLGLLYALPVIGHIAAIANRIFNSANQSPEENLKKEGNSTTPLPKSSKNTTEIKSKNNDEIQVSQKNKFSKTEKGFDPLLEVLDQPLDQPLDVQRHTAPTQEVVERMNEARQAFKDQALIAFQDPLFAEHVENFSIEEAPEELKALLRENNHQKPGSTFINYSFDICPGVVFKRLNHEKKEFDHYIESYSQAHSYIKKHHLILLQVPRVKSFEFEGSHWIAEEKIEKASGKGSLSPAKDKRHFEEGLRSYCWKDPELKPYISTIFNQLIDYAFGTDWNMNGYSIAFSKNGRMVISPSDSLNFQSITKSSQPLSGLLAILPRSELNAFVKIVKGKLPLTRQLSHAMPWSKDDPFERAKNRTTKPRERQETMLSRHGSWLERKGIVSSSQLLIKPEPEIKLFQSDEENHEKLEQLARVLIDLINVELAASCNFIPAKERTIYLLCEGTLVDKAFAIWGEERLKVHDYIGKGTPSLSGTWIPIVLDRLKVKGFLFGYENPNRSPDVFRIKC